MGFKKISSEEIQESASQPTKRFRKIDESSPFSSAKEKAGSVLSAGSKGIVQGTFDLTDLFGGGELSKQFYNELTEGENAPEYNHQQQRESVEENLDKALPSREGFAESLAQRGGRMLPGLALGGGSLGRNAVSLAGGALSGQIAEESGAGPWGQAAAEIFGSALSGSVSGKLRPKKGGRQHELIKTARKHGLSEKEITPAIQSERKIGTLSPISHKGRGTVGRIHESKSALGRIYENLRKSPAGQKHIDPSQLKNLGVEVGEEMKNLPNAVRDLVERDVMDMLKSPPNADSIMNLYQDINYHIGRGNGHLGGVRRVLEKHLTEYLGEDFKNVNELFGNVRKLGIRVRPDLGSHFHDFRTATDLSEAILSGNKKGIARSIGEIFSRFTASKFLISPYLQHIPRKVLDSALNGSVEDAKKVLTIMLNKSEKDSDE